VVEPATLFLFGRKFLCYTVNGSPRNHFRGIFWVSNLTPPITSITNPRTKRVSLRSVQTTLRGAQTTLWGAQTKQKGSAVFFAIQVVCHHLNVYRCKMNSCLNLIVEKYQTLREFFKFAFGAVYLPSGFNSAPVFVPFLHSKETITVQFYVDSVLGAKHFV